jgi:hypothetical protein
MLAGWAILRWNIQLDWRLIWAITATIAISSGVVLGHFAERPIMAWRAGLLKRHRLPRPPAVAGARERPIWGIHQ